MCTVQGCQLGHLGQIQLVIHSKFILNFLDHMSCMEALNKQNKKKSFSRFRFIMDRIAIRKHDGLEGGGNLLNNLTNILNFT